ncbi:MAG: hypothetical protein KO202_00510 [Methanobacteriaceae archaeon]|jgi:hypothetical protein|nr:hypothetical protein [Methanobacteriaceae archaeon]
MSNEELMKKCDNCELNSNNELNESCKTFLNSLKKCDEDIGVDKKEINNYIGMVESLKGKDLRKVLQLAMNINSNNSIKDTELKRDASRLIRAIQMS